MITAAATNGGNPGQPLAPIRQTAVGGGQAPTFPAGSADEAVYYFCLAMSDADTASASEFVSPKAKGILGELREGTLSEDKIGEIKNVISPVTELQTHQTDEPSPSKRSLVNKSAQIISFTLKKEKEIYRITEISYPRSKKK